MTYELAAEPEKARCTVGRAKITCRDVHSANVLSGEARDNIASHVAVEEEGGAGRQTRGYTCAVSVGPKTRLVSGDQWQHELVI
jgi:hypothetical protein